MLNHLERGLLGRNSGWSQGYTFGEVKRSFRVQIPTGTLDGKKPEILRLIMDVTFARPLTYW